MDPDWLPAQPAVYDLVVRLVLTTREPCRTQALQVQPGQPLRLQREPDNPHDPQAVRVVSLDGCAVGYLDADTAGYLAILLDHAAGLKDSSFAESIQTAAPPDNPAARRLRYPRLYLHLRLELPSAWPMFAIAAILGIKTDDFARRFNLDGNPWLQPIRDLHDQYVKNGHDQFQMPARLLRAWRYLTAGDSASAGQDQGREDHANGSAAALLPQTRIQSRSD